MSTTIFKVGKPHSDPATADRAADWRDAALCRSHPDPELWFPKGTDAVSMANEEEAKRTCRRCPVMETCAQWAIETREDSGVWGGLSEHDRASIRRRRQRAAQAAEPTARFHTFGSYEDAYTTLTREDGQHVIWVGGNVVQIGKTRTSPNQVAWRATRKTEPVGRVFADCETDGCVKHLNDQAMRQARDAARKATTERSAA